MPYTPNPDKLTWTMQEIKAANRDAGYYFFEPGALRFFGSRIGRKVYQGSGGVYFVTSEQFVGSNTVGPRRCTVRRFDPTTAAIDTVGPHCELKKNTAHAYAASLASTPVELHPSILDSLQATADATPYELVPRFP